jgi:hypothetical protein
MDLQYAGRKIAGDIQSSLTPRSNLTWLETPDCHLYPSEHARRIAQYNIAALTYMLTNVSMTLSRMPLKYRVQTCRDVIVSLQLSHQQSKEHAFLSSDEQKEGLSFSALQMYMSAVATPAPLSFRPNSSC